MEADDGSLTVEVFLFLGLLELYLSRLKIIQLKLVSYKLSTYYNITMLL